MQEEKQEKKIGRITHYFSKINVAVVELTDGELAVGDTIHIVGHTTDFTEIVESMQIEHENVEKGVPGQSIGLKVTERCREHDEVFKVIES